MAATQQVAQQAWRVTVTHQRTELYAYMDLVHRLTMGFWRSYPGNNDGSDIGPFELMHQNWYRRNRHWGQWLLRSNTWALQAKRRLYELIALLRRQCGLSYMMFKVKENHMDEILYIAVEETTELLNCYIRGWKNAAKEIQFDDWICFGSHGFVAHPPARQVRPAATRSDQLEPWEVPEASYFGFLRAPPARR